MMQLVPLTVEERDFLARGPTARGLPPQRLTRALATRLSARLRQTVRVDGVAAGVAGDPVETPRWRRDPLLDSLWLTRRLGGRQVRGNAAPPQPGLTRTLDLALAEVWLDGGEGFTLPSTLTWQVAWEGQGAVLALDLPAACAGIGRWASEVIREVG